MSYRCGDKIIIGRSSFLSFLSLPTLRTTFTELCSSFASSFSHYSAASAIHANSPSISGPEVGTSTIIDIFKTQSTSVTNHYGRCFTKKN